jgi:large subunit ribosomal protein L19
MARNDVISPVNIEARKTLGIRPGDTVRVMQKIQERGKTRLQAFEGLVLAVKHGTEPGASFTVRKTASGVGVEKVFPLFSPLVDKIEIIKRTKVRRAKLYYIREKASKEIRRAMRNAFAVGRSTDVPEEVVPEVAPEVVAEEQVVETPTEEVKAEEAPEEVKEGETKEEEAEKGEEKKEEEK